MALICAVAWRLHAARQPRYALDQIGTAIRRGDGAKLAYYADVSGFTNQIVDQSLDWLASERGTDEAIATAEIAATGDRAARVRDAKEALTDRADRAIETAAAAGFAGGPVGPHVIDAFLEEQPLATIMNGDHLDVRSVDRPVVEGDVATVPVLLRHRELVVDVALALVFHRDGPRWRLVGVGGLERALDAIDRAQLERLEIANRPREEQLAGLLGVGTPDIQRIARRRAKTFYRMRVPVTNRSTDSMATVTLALSSRTDAREHPTVLAIEHVIPPATTSTEVWELDEATIRGSRLGALLAHPERLALRVQSIVLDSAGQADTVRLLHRYAEVGKE